MCSIFGFVTNGTVDKDRLRVMAGDMLRGAVNRGRDGIGARFAHLPEPYRSYTCSTVAKAGTYTHDATINDLVTHCTLHQNLTLIGNARAEPTTEWVKYKAEYDQQPYSVGKWTIVHNGTIANDKGLRTGVHPTDIDSAAIVETLCENEATMGPKTLGEYYSVFVQSIHALKGSYAILAVHEDAPGFIFTACNYRPIWIGKNDSGVWLASEASMLPHNCVPQMQEPYTCNMVCGHSTNLDRRSFFLDEKKTPRALVVASGGLDSTVAATVVQNLGMDVTLINFQYGCRAEEHELKAIKEISEAMGVPLVLFPIPIYDPSDSPLFDHTATIAGGEAGAEFAHEWVPARNLVMLSVATAYAEAKGFDYIVLGNNLEEAGAYPDNEPEFINRFNALLPFAVGDGKRVRVLMPVGNLMKHEIVALGLEQGAPLAHTWSCYKNGDLHCGTCGPCMMRRTAFSINGAPEVIKYLTEHYEKDDGPLTDEQIDAIRKQSSATGTGDSKFNKSLL